MNKRFIYSIDVSNVDCHCNAAAYFIAMPGNNAGAGDYYCDANFGNDLTSSTVALTVLLLDKVF